MELVFFKYQGTGNDFIIIDNRKGIFPKNDISLVNRLCDRKFGIGSDGLMLLGNNKHYDFSMTYYNSDGNEGSMCGNGGRCLVAFANHLGLISKNTKFYATDGEHEAHIVEPGIISLKMTDISSLAKEKDYFFLNTGSPHYVAYETDLLKTNVFEKGKQIRYSKPFQPQGTNVNFIQEHSGELLIRTYERGVEDETLSCGTGSVAAAIASVFKEDAGKKSVNIKTLGGRLTVAFKKISNDKYVDIWLKGPAQFTFKGTINI